MTKSKTSLLLTQTLINSWLYLYQVNDGEYYDKAYQDFLKTLKRIPLEDNEIFARGREFEKQVINGEYKEIYDIIKGGSYQVSKSKSLVVDNINFTIYGIADFIKNGVIYDTKRVNQYDLQKYQYSSQHLIYLYLFDDCYEFTYLIVDNTDTFYEETYKRNDLTLTIDTLIHNFISFLKENNLFNIYLENWKGK